MRGGSVGGIGLAMRVFEQWRTAVKPSRRLCTAEVRGSNPLGSNLLTRLCLFWLASEDEMGISLGYGKHFDSLKACCTEPPSVLPFGVGVSKLRIDHHVNIKQSGSLAQERTDAVAVEDL